LPSNIPAYTKLRIFSQEEAHQPIGVASLMQKVDYEVSLNKFFDEILWCIRAPQSIWIFNRCLSKSLVLRILTPNLLTNSTHKHL
jgi:hypothetical protein